MHFEGICGLKTELNYDPLSSPYRCNCASLSFFVFPFLYFVLLLSNVFLLLFLFFKVNKRTKLLIN